MVIKPASCRPIGPIRAGCGALLSYYWAGRDELPSDQRKTGGGGDAGVEVGLNIATPALSDDWWSHDDKLGLTTILQCASTGHIHNAIVIGLLVGPVLTRIAHSVILEVPIRVNHIHNAAAVLVQYTYYRYTFS